MENYEAKELFKKYQQGTCSEEELNLINSWYTNNVEDLPDFNEVGVLKAKKDVWKNLPIHETKKPIKLWAITVIAASLILALGIGFVVFSIKNNTTKNLVASNQIVPGGNKATLKLADGSEILLNDLPKGKVLKQEGIKITKTDEGHLIYTVTSSNKSTSLFNTITTPRGGTYQVILPDGTKVWLNAESSLKYPTAFAENERIVELTGEGYFEVAHRSTQPFKVLANNQTVEVLGTHFNINAYRNESATATTLLVGSVKIITETGMKILKPGQQANVTNINIEVTNTKTANVVAWVNNNFVFENETLGSIMRKVARWYDIDFVCPAEMENLQFNGSISRSKNINQILRIMELTGAAHFKFEERRITVMP